MLVKFTFKESNSIIFTFFNTFSFYNTVSNKMQKTMQHTVQKECVRRK